MPFLNTFRTASALLLLLLFCLAVVFWTAGEGAPGRADLAGAEVRPRAEATAQPEPEAGDAPSGAVYEPFRAGFAVRFEDEVTPYRVNGLFALPGEAVRLEAVFTPKRSGARAFTAGGTLEAVAPERWRWKAPDTPGHYPLHIVSPAESDTITLNAFVMHRFDHRQETLNGYRIGRYEARPLRDDPAYLRPEGFIELTPQNRDAPVSPHFTLGQFACKQESGYPKYLLLRERLLLKLEMILEEVNERGIDVPTLHVMSGYRTPHYNRAIGNRTTYSRHLYGGAADIFVDADGDGVMDDLNGDGEITIADAQALAGIIDEKVEEAWYQPLIGGMGIYGPAPHRGPFVHVDVRGSRARW